MDLTYKFKSTFLGNVRRSNSVRELVPRIFLALYLMTLSSDLKQNIMLIANIMQATLESYEMRNATRPEKKPRLYHITR